MSWFWRHHDQQLDHEQRNDFNSYERSRIPEKRLIKEKEHRNKGRVLLQEPFLGVCQIVLNGRKNSVEDGSSQKGKADDATRPGHALQSRRDGGSSKRHSHRSPINAKTRNSTDDTRRGKEEASDVRVDEIERVKVGQEKEGHKESDIDNPHDAKQHKLSNSTLTRTHAARTIHCLRTKRVVQIRPKHNQLRKHRQIQHCAHVKQQPKVPLPVDLVRNCGIVCLH